MPTIIKIDQKLPEDLILIFNALIKNLQHRFDLAPEILEKWLNQSSFLNWVQKRYQQMEKTMLGNLTSRPEIVELLEIYHSKQPMDILIRNLGWEKEECGHLYQKYDNGYYHYCNLTRFDHLSREQKDLDHSFIRKTYQQMIDEKIFEYKFKAYQEFMNSVLRMLLNYFNQRLRQDYQVYRFNYQAEKSRPLINWLKKHPEAFRSKSGLIENNENPQIYLDIYVPRQLNLKPNGLPGLRQKPIAVL